MRPFTPWSQGVGALPALPHCVPHISTSHHLSQSPSQAQSIPLLPNLHLATAGASSPCSTASITSNTTVDPPCRHLPLAFHHVVAGLPAYNPMSAIAACPAPTDTKPGVTLVIPVRQQANPSHPSSLLLPPYSSHCLLPRFMFGSGTYHSKQV